MSIARMIEICQIEKKDAADGIELKVIIENDQYISNALLLINYSDASGVIFGTSRSQAFSLARQGCHEMIITCRTEMLLNGSYYCSAILMGLNNDGIYTKLDHKDRICVFTVQRESNLPASVSGYVLMPDASVHRNYQKVSGDETFTIELAGQTIKIKKHYNSVFKMCTDYLVEDNNPDIIISTEQSDLEYERSKEYENSKYAHSLEYIETLAVYRKIAMEMLKYNTILMHGAVIGVGNSAYMMTAPSGIGKTTFLCSFLKFIDNSYVINGDKPLLKVYDNEVLACGTPWAGKEGMNRNCVIPLKAICILERGEENSISEMSVSDAFPYIWKQTNTYENPTMTMQVLRLVQLILDRVRIFRVVFKYYDKKDNIPGDAALMAYRFMESDIVS